MWRVGCKIPGILQGKWWGISCGGPGGFGGISAYEKFQQKIFFALAARNIAQTTQKNSLITKNIGLRGLEFFPTEIGFFKAVNPISLKYRNFEN